MGMFDYFIIEENDPRFLSKGGNILHDFQTKSFGHCFGYYYTIKDNILFKGVDDYDEKIGIKKPTQWEFIEYTGEIRIYTTDIHVKPIVARYCKEQEFTTEFFPWCEFVLIFDKGKLLIIRMNANSETRTEKLVKVKYMDGYTIISEDFPITSVLEENSAD